MAISTIKVTRPAHPGLFGGMGFNNIDISMYDMIDRPYFDQYIRKCNRELAPGFARCWGGFAEWTKEDMDKYAEYYSQIMAETDTTMYLVPGRARSHETAEERRKWASDVADRLAYLYFEKGMKHLKYYCMSNEQSLEHWGAMIDDMPMLKEYHTYLYREFQRRNLPIQLMAPDVSEPTNYHTLFWAMGHMGDVTGAYTSHLYLHGTFDAEDLGMYKYLTRLMARCAAGAKGQEKLFILSEYGWGQFHGNAKTADGDVADCVYPSAVGCTLDFPRYADSDKEAYSQLSIAEMNLACINAGVFATGYWTFVDYPDPMIFAYRNSEDGKKFYQNAPFLGWGIDIRYNKCGVLRWNDFENPTSSSYWCLGIMTRYMKQNTHILYNTSDDSLLRTAVLQDRQKHISVCIVNRHDTAQDVRLELGALADRPLRKFEYDPNNVPRNAFADLQDYSELVSVNADGIAQTTLLPNSVTILTTDYEERIPAMAENVRVEGDTLVWDAVSEKEHRYYRVFADGKQIASTVAEALRVSDANAKYQVASVDCYGNCAIRRA